MAARHASAPREIVTARIEVELIIKLDELAEKERRSRSEMVEMAVREYLDHRHKKSK